MKKTRFKPLAAEYALGVLEAKDQQALENNLLTDIDLKQQVDEWEQQLAPLADAIPEVTPPDAVWNKIEASLNADTPAGTKTLRANQGNWEVLLPGVTKKLLHSDPLAGFQTYLLKLEPNTYLPAHPHRLLEECYMLEGDLSIGDMSLHAHDYHVVPAGVDHDAVYSQKGALVLLRGEIHESMSH